MESNVKMGIPKRISFVVSLIVGIGVSSFPGESEG
jgi:hypothetical protein